MKLCLFCDLHLPTNKDALQYDALRCALADIKEKKPDGILFAGDVTCDGNLAVYEWFLLQMSTLGIPFFYIPGNSDLRCEESRARIFTMASPVQSTLADTCVFALNDSSLSLSACALEALSAAKDGDVVFLHHPPSQLAKESRDEMLSFCRTHPGVTVFYGHLHLAFSEGNTVSLGALDPDKAIGEAPSMTYFDTETGDLSYYFYPCPMPTDFRAHLGISAYCPIEQIRFAAKERLPYLELRPNCLDIEEAALSAALATWREAGGKELSLHLPEIGYKAGCVYPDARLSSYFALASRLGVTRFTQHVPCVTADEIARDEMALSAIADVLAAYLNKMPYPVALGVENMHMTAADRAGARRFGYLPEECLAFMEAIALRTHQRVGINFDIGHARNNAPLSQQYQVSTWLAMVGKHAIGYHLHQVTVKEDGSFENHMPFTEIYGKLISLASFFCAWEQGQIKKAPLVLEMRPEGAYETTLSCFAQEE